MSLKIESEIHQLKTQRSGDYFKSSHLQSEGRGFLIHKVSESEEESFKHNNSSLSADLAAALNPLNSCCCWLLLRRRRSVRRIPSGSSGFLSGSSSLTATTVLVEVIGVVIWCLPQIIMDPVRPPPTTLPQPPALLMDTDEDRAGIELGHVDSDEELYQEFDDDTDT